MRGALSSAVLQVRSLSRWAVAAVGVPLRLRQRSAPENAPDVDRKHKSLPGQ